MSLYCTAFMYASRGNRGELVHIPARPCRWTNESVSTVWSFREDCKATGVQADGDSTHHDDVINWKHFPRYWPFMRGIHRSPVNSQHKGQWRRALMFTLICTWINGWVNNREAGDLRRHQAHYDVTIMVLGDFYNGKSTPIALRCMHEVHGHLTEYTIAIC